MAKKSNRSEFPSVAQASISCSASAGTGTQTRITDSYNAEDMIAWILHAVVYAWEDSLRAQLNTDADRVKYGLSWLGSQPTGGFELNDTGVIDWHSLMRIDIAAPVADVVVIEQGELSVDWTNLPGGGRLVHPCNLFGWTYPDAAIAASQNLNLLIYYSAIEITQNLYDDLWRAIWVQQQ